ncbi:BREX system ATP-binding domain-containing protein [Prochlorothrix hollandica]|uniref:ATP-binding protein n=1 Tax=Prochlorothrix hollandica PCC 9006 = CALU 1027 TaxID=317619 RepID=A0A0M2PTE0_PROHO|nr:BREX system ATP-binding domain-containing protein [Prochlorothrix hollandica]KKI99780.1 hypothetical protein PROH_07930 [Prochlorothrix hollandica PCC 9006 = CALU 1027]
MNANPRQVIESLRYGIPPEGYIDYFTVGRQTEIAELRKILKDHTDKALLLKANYGSGKSHLIRFIRETALDQNYAVSSVTLDSQSGIRFNRMDQITGEIFRNLEVPESSQDDKKGIGVFFDWVLSTYSANKTWQAISNSGKWNYPHKFIDSPPLFLALRAWNSEKINEDIVIDWLYQRGSYRKRDIERELLTKGSISYSNPLDIFAPLRWRQHTSSTILNWKINDYEQCWYALQDLDTLAVASGLRGLVILFDEFEDIIYNLRDIRYQQAAFDNLFNFFDNQIFKGLSFFAVTPGFIDKCKLLLHSKGRWHHNYSLFDDLKTFEMSPLEVEDLRELANKIKDFHGKAYDWDVYSSAVSGAIEMVINEKAYLAVQNRARQTICAIVQCLDNLLEEED